MSLLALAAFLVAAYLLYWIFRGAKIKRRTVTRRFLIFRSSVRGVSPRSLYVPLPLGYRLVFWEKK